MTNKPHKIRVLDEKYNEFMTMNEDELKNFRDVWYPGGSGPIGAMYAITALVKVVATLRGFDTSTWED